jgi:colanic acid biosynthesis glycosyl transferase WcaI
MRLLIYGINFYPEAIGVGKYTGDTAIWLAARGHEVRVVTSPPFNPQARVWPGYHGWRYRKERLSKQSSDPQAPPLPVGKEISVLRCPIWVPKAATTLKRLLHLASFAMSSFVPLLRQAAWRPNVVLVVEPTLFCAPQALLLARLSKAKAWLHVQDLEVDAAFELGDLHYSRARNWALAFESRLLRQFNRVSTISERMMQRLIGKGVESPRCVLFPNWVDVRRIFPSPTSSPLRRELGISESTVVALYSGSMGKKQGLEVLVEVARRVVDHPELFFVFCGDGSYRQALAEQITGLPNVRLLPLQPTERLNDLLNLADIHLLPQRADAADLVMPSKLTGMFASGRPVIATASLGTQLASAVTGHGIVVPPGDVASLVAAVLKLGADTEMRLRLGNRARDYAVAHLDLTPVLSRFEHALLGACGHTTKGAHSDFNNQDLEELQPSGSADLSWRG